MALARVEGEGVREAAAAAEWLAGGPLVPRWTVGGCKWTTACSFKITRKGRGVAAAGQWMYSWYVFFVWLI